MANDEEQREMYRCTLCDDNVEKRGQYGHLKFTDGEGHGPKGEVPQNGDEYFIKLSDEDEGNSDEDEATESGADREGNADTNTDGSQSTESSDTDGSESGNGDTPDGTETAGETADNRSLKEILTTPVNELL